MTSQTFFRTLVRFILPLFFIAVLSQCSEDPLLTTTDPTNTVNQTIIQSTTTGSLDCSTCTYIVPPNKTTIDGKVIGIKPGDVICLNAATTYGYITFQNIVGASSNPVIVTNCGGTVTINAPAKPFVVRFNSSKFFRFTGGNINKTYGIKLTGAATNGLVMGYLTTNFVVDHIEVFKVGFSGIMAKTDPNCDNATIRGNFTMRNVAFRQNYIHDTGGEGFYIGHTSYNGVQTSCGFRLPHTIENVKIHDNIVRNSGWDGIQLASAPKGAHIYNNLVENYSVANQKDQMGGIAIGAGTGGTCYGNYINGGNGPGIAVFGLADNTVHNNLIVNAGSIGIFCDERTAPGSGYRFINNTIINPKEDGFRIYAEKVPMNLVINNIVVNPGNYSLYGQNAYVKKLNSYVKVDMTNNYFTTNIANVKFVNAMAFNFRLTSTSPLINKGRDISTFSISRDFYRTARLKGSAYDIGASEY